MRLNTDIINITLDSIYGVYTLSRCGKICFFTLSNITNLPNGSTVVCNIPNGFRPPIGINRTASVPGTTTSVRIHIAENGNITIYNYSTNTGILNISECISFPIAKIDQ